MKTKDDEFLDPIDAGGGDEPAATPGGEPAPQQQPAGETTEQATPADEGKPKPEKAATGDLNVALRQAREEGKAERKRREELEARYSRLETNTNRLLERFTQEQQPQQQYEDPDPEPPDTDPIAQLQWTRRQVSSLRGYLSNQYQQQQQVTAQEQAESDAINAVSGRFDMMVAERPELQDAANHLLSSISREFAAYGMDGMMPNGKVANGSPLQRAVIKQIKDIALWCFNNRIPIENVYEQMAVARGWQPPQPQPGADQQQEQQPEQGDGRARDDKGRFVKADDVVPERAAQLQASQQANRSLSQGSGAPTKKMTAKELAEMSEEEMWAEFGRQKNTRTFDREMNFR